MPETEAGVVVLALTLMDIDEPGSYALAREAQWDADTPMVTVWRGPDKHDETFARNTLEEMECSTIGVDDDGFFTCPNPIYNEELQELVKDKAEELMLEEANRNAAESWSYSEPMQDKYGEDVFVVATFGDAVAVNGEIWGGDEDPKPPRGWESVDDGGQIPTGEEAQIEKDSLAERVAFIVSNELARCIPTEAVVKILSDVLGDDRDYTYWNSDSGESEVWVSPETLEAYEEEREIEGEARRKLALERILQRREEERGQRRSKIKAGGWPKSKDWSPKGELPDD